MQKNIDILQGLNNCTDPSIARYKEGVMYRSDNSRIDKEGIWNKGPSLASPSSAPTVKTVPAKTGNHFAEMFVKGVHIIAQKLGNSDTIAQGPNSYAYFLASGTVKWWDGVAAVENTNYGTAGVTAPATDPTVATILTGTRMEDGVYYYFYTYYNTARKVESLPSDVIEYWVRRYYTNDVRQADVPTLTGTALAGHTLRWYRSKCIRVRKDDMAQLGQENSPTEFYFLGEGTTWNDYAHDSEIVDPTNIYTGRGTAPPTSVDAIATFDNRVFYFVDEDVYWSSAGRPEEVPQEYTLTINQDYTQGSFGSGTTQTDEVLAVGTTVSTALTQKPFLDTGLYGEAKMKVAELVGKTVIRAQEYKGKLWIWTNKTTGYIESTAKYEGYYYRTVDAGVGVCSPHVIAVTPFGMFGADAKGVWRITDRMERLSYGVIDIDDSNKSTYCASANLAASFGVWVGELNEYWWSVNNVQIVYQADADRFVGPYSLTLSGGTAFSTSGGEQCYLTGGYTPSLSSRTGIQTLQFWIGQESAPVVKDNLQMEVFYTSITADTDVTIIVRSNKVAALTSGFRSSPTMTHSDDNLIGYIEPHLSGRYFRIEMSVPTDCTAPIAGINYTADLTPKINRNLR